MAYNITVIPGDGVGPETTGATRRVLEATGIKFNWEVLEIGSDANTPDSNYGEKVLESIRRNKIAIKGPTSSNPGYSAVPLNSIIRKGLDLYAMVRPCKTLPGVPSPFKNVDIVIVRENTEDLHAGIEFRDGSIETAKLIQIVNELTGKKIKPDAGISLKITTKSASERIINFAFDYARKNNRKKVAVTHKASVMRMTDGFFLKTAREIAEHYPEIEFRDINIDNLAMQLVRDPEQFDVIVLQNLYGDIVSDLCAGIIGGLGVAPGEDIGDGIAVFEAAHGIAPDIAGQNIVNPVALMLSGVLMLRYIMETKAADRLEKAILDVLVEGKYVTNDIIPDKIGGVGTSQVTQAVIAKLLQ